MESRVSQQGPRKEGVSVATVRNYDSILNAGTHGSRESVDPTIVQASLHNRDLELSFTHS